MSRLSELIRDLCPDGVEYRPLGEVAELQRGSGMPKALFREKGVKAIHYGHIYTTYGVYIRDAIVTVDAHAAKKLTTVHPGDLVVANTSENLEDVGSAVAWLGDVDAVTGGHATVVRSTMDSRFLSYYFRTPQFYYEKRRFASGTKVIELSAAKLARIRIPVPPLEVQQEIVRILDQFTTLEAELEAELEARRKQYEYYRDLLIESCDRTGEGLLGDSSSIFRGASPRPIRSYVTRSGGVPWIKIGDVGSDDKYVTHTAECITSEGAKRSRRVFPGNFILSNSMSFGRPYISKIEGCVHDGWLIVSSFDEAYISDFLYHLLRSSLVQMSFRQRAGRGTVRNLNVDIVAATQVPLVPLEEQKRVLRLLDRFDALVNDISSGLPAEIAARRKQYEHYRDRLLSFPEKKA